MNILCIESFCPQKKTHDRTLLFSSILLKHGLRLDCWSQPLNMLMRVSYLDCHEAELCCYLVILIGNLLRPLQMFYFHLWRIYWLSLVHLLQFSNPQQNISTYRIDTINSNKRLLVPSWFLHNLGSWYVLTP
jgi:hypothetical protein